MPEITDRQFNEIIDIFAGFEKLYRELNKNAGYQVSQATAYRQYGRNRVNRWAREGKVNPVKHGSRIYYDAYSLLQSSKNNQS